nr:MAG TPA: hypothetical protein [Caudoviricetes sp.]
MKLFKAMIHKGKAKVTAKENKVSNDIYSDLLDIDKEYTNYLKAGGKPNRIKSIEDLRALKWN